MIITSFLIMATFFLVHTNIVNTWPRYEWNQIYFRAMATSSALGMVCIHLLFVYYFVKSPWDEVLIAYLAFLIAPRIIVPKISSYENSGWAGRLAFLSFIAWPAAAVWTYIQILAISS